MRALEMLEYLKKKATLYAPKAKESVLRNNHMNGLQNDEVVNQLHIEAVLVDFINFIAGESWIDYALYTVDIQPALPFIPLEDKDLPF